MKIAVVIVLVLLIGLIVHDWITDKEKNWLSISADIAKIVMGILIVSMFYESIDRLIPMPVGITLGVICVIIVSAELIVEFVKNSKNKKSK